MSEFTHHLKTCGHAPYRCLAYPDCTAIIKRNEVHTHKNVCDYTKVRCKYFHSHVLLRKDLEEHEQKLCEFKTIPCKGWKVSYYKTALKNHEADCKDYPIVCKSCEGVVRREDLDDHYDVWPRALTKWLAYNECNFETVKESIEEHQRHCEHVYDIHKEMIAELKENIEAKNNLIRSLTHQLNEKANKFSLSSLFS